ncbi:MAG: energy-coupling factor transporter transmembrane component T [Coriobacteriia bacterium]|nr:energy-coupling factor transporter transmembrane component T [Coriobacteriia bacterium]
MRRKEQRAAFASCHASVPATLFAGILALTMFCVQPVLVAISLMGALAFSALARGGRATLAGLRWQLPMLVLVCLANPFFSASGSTLLLRLGPVCIYLESLAYGAVMGALMVAVVLWFEGAAAVLTQDRLLGLAHGRAASISLVISMSAQLMPQMLRRGRGVEASLAACTAAGPCPGLRDRLTRESGQLMGWALEDSLERADAMRARGWESGARRTSYQPDVLCESDAARLCGIVLALAACALLAVAACAQWRFYPTMPSLLAWWGYVPYAALMFLPAGAALSERLRWRGLE